MGSWPAVHAVTADGGHALFGRLAKFPLVLRTVLPHSQEPAQSEYFMLAFIAKVTFALFVSCKGLEKGCKLDVLFFIIP